MTKRAKLAKRPNYRPERRPARAKGVFKDEAPLACPGATKYEIVTALCVVAKQLGIQIGRGVGYDKHRDEYTVIGKTGRFALPQDYVIPGEYVAACILLWRKTMGAAQQQGISPRMWLERKGYVPKRSSSAPQQAPAAGTSAAPLAAGPSVAAASRS